MSMLAIFKPVGAELVLDATPTTVNNAKLVRITNDTASPVVVTLQTPDLEIYSTFTILPMSEKLLQKSPVVTVAAASAIKVVASNF